MPRIKIQPMAILDKSLSVPLLKVITKSMEKSLSSVSCLPGTDQ